MTILELLLLHLSVDGPVKAIACDQQRDQAAVLGRQTYQRFEANQALIGHTEDRLIVQNKFLMEDAHRVAFSLTPCGLHRVIHFGHNEADAIATIGLAFVEPQICAFKSRSGSVPSDGASEIPTLIAASGRAPPDADISASDLIDLVLGRYTRVKMSSRKTTDVHAFKSW